MTGAPLILHASCVAVEGRGVLITGPSGSGKSALALQLVAMGAQLVADDRTVLQTKAGVLHASSPAAIAGMIEARGVGILTIPHLAQATVSLAVDLAQLENTRLPVQHITRVLDIELTCLHKVDAPYFPAAIHAFLIGRRNETP